MHELSVALSIVEMATEEATRHDGHVSAVHLRLGPLSGIVKDALLFSYQVACQDTPLDGSRLVIEDVPLVVYCPHCRARRELGSIQSLTCDTCGALTPDIRAGRELELVALEIEA
jgi:hydrogenase nickel incorporation protein HypA/HybF